MNKYTVIRSNDHLAHYGVLGMKWGVRKQRPSSGLTRSRSSYRVTSKSSKRSSRSGARSSETNRKSTSSRRKKAILIGAAALGVALGAYGGYKLKTINTKKHNKRIANVIMESASESLDSSVWALNRASEKNYGDYTKRLMSDSVDRNWRLYNNASGLASEITSSKKKVNPDKAYKAYTNLIYGR